MRSDKSGRAALLWDESYLWGLFSLRSLSARGLACSLLSAAEIKAGALEGYGTLMVPGGWASNKIKALGPKGATAIKDFVHGGGNYFGICGGAGLATSDGLGLVDISRKPTSERVPSLSGPVKLLLNAHPLWEGVAEPVFNVWWPSQFVINSHETGALATFESATDEAMSSDLCVGDVRNAIRNTEGPGGWSAYEEDYGLNLDPARMSGDPLVVESTFGKGRTLLSLVHFDTPGDEGGGHVLDNIWRYLGVQEGPGASGRTDKQKGHGGRLLEAASRPFEFGLRNFLWFRRGPLVQWRRGVRGLEYFTLYELARELSELGKDSSPEALALAREVEDFGGKACELLTLERQAIGRGEPITFANASGRRMAELRADLFSRSKSHGGRFRSILTTMGSLLFTALKKD